MVWVWLVKSCLIPGQKEMLGLPLLEKELEPLKTHSSFLLFSRSVVVLMSEQIFFSVKN